MIHCQFWTDNNERNMNIFDDIDDVRVLEMIIVCFMYY